MEARLKIETVHPRGIQALYRLEEYLATTSLSIQQKHLIKIRASQVNGCAFCVNMHTQHARESGETGQRLQLICVWKEAHGIFTPEERLLFAVTEEITLIHQHGLSDDLYQKTVQTFGMEQTAEIIMAVIITNAWNRLAISLQTQPPLQTVK
jgi:AhpD family alkylhydroperoxidase